MTFASYAATVAYDIDVSLQKQVVEQPRVEFYRLTYFVEARDYAGNVIDRIELKTEPGQIETSVVVDPRAVLKLAGTVHLSGSTPIASVVISPLQAQIADQDAPNVYTELVLNQMVFIGGEVSLSAIEESADIPLRPVHLCIFEGVNTSATLTFHAAACISAVPSSENAFLASAGRRMDDVDEVRVRAYLTNLTGSIPHVQTVSGKLLTMASYDTLKDSQLPQALAAFSFNSLKKGLKKVRKAAKTVRAVADKVGVTPLLNEAIDTGISMVPGGPMARMGARMAYKAALE